VSAPLAWSEVADAEPEAFTLKTMVERFRRIGDRHRDIDAHTGSLEVLLDLSERQARAGQGEAPWPPHYAKQKGEPSRVMPSRRKRAPARTAS
jgi:hypothetical protein